MKVQKWEFWHHIYWVFTSRQHKQLLPSSILIKTAMIIPSVSYLLPFRFYPSTEGVTASTKRSGRYSGLAQLFYRPSSLILLLTTILFISLLFSSLTFYLPDFLSLPKDHFSDLPDHFPPVSSKRFTRIPTPFHATPPHRHLIIAAPTYTITQSHHPTSIWSYPTCKSSSKQLLNKPISTSHVDVM